MPNAVAAPAKLQNKLKLLPTRADLHARLKPFAQANSFQGYKSFAVDVGLYMIGMAAVLMMEGVGWKIAGGILAGLALVNLGSLSHEAAHKALVKSRRGNKVLAVVTMTMCLFNYRLWIYDHHVLHHGRTNVKENNFLSPITPAEYRARGPFRRAIYRAYHSRTGLGVLLYFLLERWPTIHFLPAAWLPKRFHASAFGYAALLAAYIGSLLGLLVFASTGSVVASVLCGFVLPYAIWFMTFSMTVFLQHTNPRVRWYRDVSSIGNAPEALSVHVIMPRLINHVTHYAMEHPVHHVSAMIPHYRLKQAQAALAGIAQPDIVVMPFTIGNMRDVLRRCRLYDYEAHAWLDFNGEVMAIPRDDAALRIERDPHGGLLPDQAEPGSPGIFFPESQKESEVQPKTPAPREEA